MLLSAMRSAATGRKKGSPTRLDVLAIACTSPCSPLISDNDSDSNTQTGAMMYQNQTVSHPANRANGMVRRAFLISSAMNDAVSHPPKAKVSTDQKMISFRRRLGVMV